MKKEDIKNKIETYKNEGIGAGIEKLKGSNKKIKKFIAITLTGAVAVGVLGAGTAYAYVKSNVNYSQSQLEKIALKEIQGEIVGVKKDIDEDNMALAYEFKIKDKNNMINEIELDSKTGAIIDIENYNDKYSDDDNNKYNDNKEDYNYNEIKSKSKFSEEQLKNIALNRIQGEVIGVDKEIEEDTMSIVYEFKIKDKNNIIQEIEVDSVTGKIVDVENYNLDSDKKQEVKDIESNNAESNEKSAN